MIAAVSFGRANNLLTAIRGGGHNVGGRAPCDDGLVIDLFRMRSAFVDDATRRVRVQGGATLGDLDRETHVFGLASYVPFSRNFPPATLGDEFMHKLHRSTVFTQSLYFYPNFSNTSEYRTTFNLGTITKISKWLGWQNLFGDIYVSNPPQAGRKTTSFHHRLERNVNTLGGNKINLTRDWSSQFRSCDKLALQQRLTGIR